jgi:hypothetical protein
MTCSLAPAGRPRSLILTLLLLAAGVLAAAEAPAEAAPAAAAVAATDTAAAPVPTPLSSGGADTAAVAVRPRPFGVGERFEFSIDYGPVNAGNATLAVVGTVEFDGHSCYRVESTASSNRFFSGFYKVRDKVVSYVDRQGLFSRYFMKRLREGSYRKTEEIVFDHVAGVARDHAGDEYEVPAGVHDPLSAFYYVRTLDLEVGKDVFLTAHESDDTYELRVIVHRQEAVETGLGTFDCFVVQPIMLGEGIFKHEGDLMIYLTADARRIPVLMTTELPVGSVKAQLQAYTLSDGRTGGEAGADD